MPIIVSTVDDIDPLLNKVRAAANRTAQALTSLTSSELDGLEVLRRMKFTQMAWHPIDDRELNLVEQINQTWTYLVSLEAARFLLERDPGVGLRLNLGTEAGTDIESLEPNLVAAETFAAVHPSNNRKLAKDLQKLACECPDVRAKYVFFSAPGFEHRQRHKERETVDGIEVWSIDCLDKPHRP